MFRGHGYGLLVINRRRRGYLSFFQTRIADDDDDGDHYYYQKRKSRTKICIYYIQILLKLNGLPK